MSVSAGESRPQDQSPPQEPDDGQTAPEQEYGDQAKSGEDPDVLLDVPVLNIEELNLELKDLRAHISLRAELADLVSVNVGVDAYLDEVKLEIKGVEAQVLLKVSLERVLETFNRALETIDHNPEILGGKPRATPNSAEGANLPPDSTPLGETTDEAGHKVRRSVDMSGDLMDTTLDDSGEVTDEVVTGSVEDLPVEQEYTDDEGRAVTLARDDLGHLVERTADEQGNIVGLNVPEAPAPEREGSPVEATTAAKAKARELGLDLSDVKGTGSGGRILVKDLAEAAERQT